MSTPLTVAYPLFVYGTLLTGELAHSLLQPYLTSTAPGLLAGADLYSLGSYPVAVIGRGHVVGELLWLNSENLESALDRLDAYEGSSYTRETRIIQDLARNVPVTAWVYLGQQSPPQSIFARIEDGDWRAHRRRSGR